MIVAIPTSGKDLDSRVDSRLGRSVGFILYDTDKNSFRFFENRLDELAQEGAGVQAARFLLREKVESVITGHCGPKAFHLFSEAGVPVYSGVNCSIFSALEDLASGKLCALESADVKEHWS